MQLDLLTSFPLGYDTESTSSAPVKATNPAMEAQCLGNYCLHRICDRQGYADIPRAHILLIVENVHGLHDGILGLSRSISAGYSVEKGGNGSLPSTSFPMHESDYYW